MASPNEIIDAIETLAVHCRPPVMSADERSRWIASWIEDLRTYPADAVNAACRRWRNGTDRRFPLPGQLKPMVEAEDRTHDKPADNRSWRPLTPAEYDALTLREKIRHQTILAHECRLKAGPQARDKTPVSASDMPDSWHEHRRQADEHEAEAKRLRKALRDAERAAA